MIPTIFEFGPIPIRSFGLMVALALAVGAMRLAKSLGRYGIDPALAERYVMAGGISGLLGARVWFIAEHWSEMRHDLWGAISASAGFTFYGGFIIAAMVVYVMARRDGVSVARLCDALGPCLALGYAVGRLGCQLSGDGDYGIPTSSWWGMAYDTGVVPTPPGQMVYPTPLLESALSLVVAWMLGSVEISERFKAALQRFGLYLVLMSLERFFVEFLRPNPYFIGTLSEAQIIAIGLLLIGVVALVRPKAAHTVTP